jgi:biopolymer transport protein ExbB/TolQ
MAHDFSILQVMWKGGGSILLLIALSIVVFAVLYDRWSYYRKNFQKREEVMAGLEPFLDKKIFPECLAACDRNGTFLAKVVRAGLVAKSEKTDVQQALEREAKIQILNMESRLPLLATIGSIAPFVGLFGTVLGIIQAFRDLTSSEASGAAVVSLGIAEALYATAAGLFVALTAVVIYNVFQARLNRMALEAEIVISEINERFGN